MSCSLTCENSVEGRGGRTKPAGKCKNEHYDQVTLQSAFASNDLILIR